MLVAVPAALAALPTAAVAFFAALWSYRLLRAGDGEGAMVLSILMFLLGWGVWAAAFSLASRIEAPSRLAGRLASAAAGELDVSKLTLAEANTLLAAAGHSSDSLLSLSARTGRDCGRADGLGPSRPVVRQMNSVIWLHSVFPAHTRHLASRLERMVNSWRLSPSRVAALGMSGRSLASMLHLGSPDGAEMREFLDRLVHCSGLMEDAPFVSGEGSVADGCGLGRYERLSELIFRAASLDASRREFLLAMIDAAAPGRWAASNVANLEPAVRGAERLTPEQREAALGLAPSWRGGFADLLATAESV